MASIRKKTRLQKKRVTKTTKSTNKFKIREGKVKDYQKAVTLRLNEMNEFRQLVQQTLTSYATILDDPLSDELGEGRTLMMTTCGTIFSDIQRFDAEVVNCYRDAEAFLAKTDNSAFEMHLEALNIMSNTSTVLDEHTQLFMLNLAEIQTIQVTPEEEK